MNILDKYTTLLSGLHLNRHIIPYLYNINVYDDRKSIRHSRMGFMSRAEPASGECHPPSLPVPVLRKNNDRPNLSLPAGCALSSKAPRFYIRLKQTVYPILLIQIRFIDHLFIGKQFFSP